MAVNGVHLIVFANEKGGSGKSTTAVHTAIGLAKAGRRVAALDLDTRQRTLGRYLDNRAETVRRESVDLILPVHGVLDPLTVPALEAAVDPRLADARGRTLHLLFSRFVAEDLVHMAEEEEMVWPQLCALFSDVELAEIEAAIVGSLPPEIAMGFMQLMVPATNAAERAALLGGMKANAPAEAYAAVYELAARPSLTPDQLAELVALGLAA